MPEPVHNKMSGSREGPDFDDPHQNHVAVKPEETPVVESLPAPAPPAKEEKAKGKPDADNVVSQPEKS